MNKFFKFENKLENKTPNKHFGFFFSFLFLLISIFIYFNYGKLNFTSVFLFLSISLALITIINSEWLSLPNMIWFQFGILLGKFINPIVMFFIFFIIFIPIGLVLKIFRYDPLKKYSNVFDTKTFWIERKLLPEKTTKQF